MADTKSQEQPTRKRLRSNKGLSVTAMNTRKTEEEFPVLKALASRQTDDEFSTFYTEAGTGLQIVEPMYPPAVLSRYALTSGALRTCIAAMATNIDGFGYSLEFIGKEGERDNADAQAELMRASGLLDHPNGEYSLIALRERFRLDREAMGYGTIEVVRNATDGFPDLLYHTPAHLVRMTRKENTTTKARRYMPRPGASNSMVEVFTRFRRYVQISGGKRVYFRENGDTRPIDSVTGNPIAGAGRKDGQATDIVMDYIYAPGARYGTPRWIGELRSVLGVQESENTNLSFFKDNGIPAMFMFLLGGRLSPQAELDFKTGMNANRGAAMQNKIALLQIEGDADAATEDGAVPVPRVHIERLVQDRQSDAFFQQYEINSSKKIRSAFRLPALFTGLSEEIRYAVASASLTVAENQVFGPERGQTDDLFNYQILTYNGEPMKYWRFRSNPPRITDEAAVMKALETFDKVGAMTPNIAIGIANEMFDMRIESITDDWGDMPFILTTDPNIPGEVPAAPGAPTAGDAGGTTKSATPPVAVRRRSRKDHADAKYPRHTRGTVRKAAIQGSGTVDATAAKIAGGSDA